MQGTSKAIMGATLSLVATLAIVLSLILILLAHLYCSILLRSLHRRRQPPISTAETSSHGRAELITSLGNLYSRGVLQAPRSFLFPSKTSIEDHKLDQTINEENHDRNDLVIDVGLNQSQLSVDVEEGLVYISNPIYDNEEGGERKGESCTTPFETPNSSPSQLERESTSSSGNEDDDEMVVMTITPPLTPMKKLPAEGCSVELRDGGLLGSSESDSNSKKYGLSPSSSSSGSPCTSPSW